MTPPNTIRGVARQAGGWRIAGNVLALIGVMVVVFGLVLGVFGAIVETQQQRAAEVTHG